MAKKLSAAEVSYAGGSSVPEGSKTEQPEKPHVNGYDFVHPARVDKAQLKTLEDLHDNFARLLSSTLSARMRTVVDVDTAFVDQTTYREFIASLSNPSCSYQFKLGPTGGQAIIDIGPQVVQGYIDRRLGGKGSGEGVTARAMSPLDMGELAYLCKGMVEDLEATWHPILRVEISDIELETHPEFMEIVPDREVVLLLAFEVNTANMKGLICVCYPFLTMQSVLPLLTQGDFARGGDLRDEELVLQNRLRLGTAPLQAAAHLGTAQLTVAEARSLRVGDVIRSATRVEDAVPVLIEGKPLFLGRPFAAKDGTQMIKIAADIPPEQEWVCE